LLWLIFFKFSTDRLYAITEHLLQILFFAEGLEKGRLNRLPFSSCFRQNKTIMFHLATLLLVHFGATPPALLTLLSAPALWRRLATPLRCRWMRLSPARRSASLFHPAN